MSYTTTYYCGKHNVRGTTSCGPCFQEDEQRGKPARKNLIEAKQALDEAWLRIDAVNRHNPTQNDNLRETLVLVALTRRALGDALGDLEDE